MDHSLKSRTLGNYNDLALISFTRKLCVLGGCPADQGHTLGFVGPLHAALASIPAQVFTDSASDITTASSSFPRSAGDAGTRVMKP